MILYILYSPDYEYGYQLYEGTFKTKEAMIKCAENIEGNKLKILDDKLIDESGLVCFYFITINTNDLL